MRSPALRTHRWDNRNPYFSFHPLHSLFSLVAAMILLGIVMWFALSMAR
ncbi:MAG TPA: hypothetical protein VLT90_11395 [Terriglobales bacterium]|nr:hypothetical protein [Terriglobales bacterium]